MDSFRFLSNVPLSIAEATVNTLNKAGANERRTPTSTSGSSHYESTKRYAKGDVEDIYKAWMMGMMGRSSGMERRATVSANLTFGYVTKDVSTLSFLP